ncbi:MAG: ABC transporter permease [Bacteroidales bacterium]|jgi:ABC-2 type transport system permease protein
MKKTTFLIIKREYLSKVKKRSFIVMTILGPVLIAATILLVIYLNSKQDDKALVHVIDETNIFADHLNDTENYTFVRSYDNIDSLKQRLVKTGDYNLLYIPATKLNIPENGIIYSNKQPTLNLKTYISNSMGKQVEKLKLSAEISKQIEKTMPDYNPAADSATRDLISETILEKIKTDIKLTTVKTDDSGNEKESYTEVAMIIGYVTSLLIYMFIFMYGSQVMSGVLEEKTSRIIEVIVSSVKPFQLMLGKIVGIALVGLTQFLLWIVLTFAILTSAQLIFPQYFSAESANTTTNLVLTDDLQGGPDMNMISQSGSANNQLVEEAFNVIKSFNIPVILITFIIYFLIGYLLYAALFAAIGAAVDNDADTNQFMFPISVPLLLGILVSPQIIQNPEGPLAFWLSMIPFTSPIVMLTRVPFGVPYWELILSVALLILGFLGCVWIAGKIYRTGILMYGKKVTYKELWKWIRYKN